MRIALVNPNWAFDGGIYFGCREPHLPIEYAWGRAHRYYLEQFARFSDVQNETPLPLRELERAALA